MRIFRKKEVDLDPHSSAGATSSEILMYLVEYYFLASFQSHLEKGSQAEELDEIIILVWKQSSAAVCYLRINQDDTVHHSSLEQPSRLLHNERPTKACMCVHKIE